MNRSKIKQKNRISRHRRIRARIFGTSKKPRITVFKSNRNLFVQFIDDVGHVTLLSNELKAKKSKGSKSEWAKALGDMLAKKAKESGISEVIFDRGGYKYHGRVKALADGLREGGLKF